MLVIFVVHALLVQMTSGQDYTITQINSTSGLYYENIGQVLLSNSHWTFVTSVDYKGYLLFYEYLQQQAEKLQEFCDKTKLDMCKDRLGAIRDTMSDISKTDETMANFLGLKITKRSKRSWDTAITVFGQYVLSPFVEGLTNKLFGTQESLDLSVYDEQISQLQTAQENFANQLQYQATIFKIDSEKKAEEINDLRNIQSQLALNLQIQQQTQQQDSVDKEQKIASIQSLLKECNEKILKVKKAQEKTANDTEELKNNVKNIYEGLEALKQQSDNNTNRIDTLESQMKLTSITSNFLILLSRFQADQKTLFSAIVNSNRGFLDPYIITPLNLIQMMSNVQSHLPEGFMFPFHANYENARKLYKLIEPRFYLYNGKIMFVLKISLVQNKTFNLLKMTSLPFSINRNSFAFVLPRQPYLLASKQDTEYTLISENEFRDSCKVVEQELFLCYRIQTTPIVDSNVECELNIYLSRPGNLRECDIRLMAIEEPVFIQLLEPKTWIYASPTTNDLVVNCGNNRKFVDLRNTGILQLGNCTASRKQITFQAYLDPMIPKVFSNYSSNVNLMEHIPIARVPVSPVKKGNILPFKFDDLEMISHSLKELDQSLKRNGENDKSDINNYIIIIAFFVFVTVIIAVIVSREKMLKLGRVFILSNTTQSVLPNDVTVQDQVHHSNMDVTKADVLKH